MRYGFVIDQNRCIGCHACTVACKEENQVPVGVFRTWVKYVEKGEFPHTRRHFGVLRCNHCENAPCVEICPTRALYRRPDGIVDFDNRRCIGCKACMQACPYDALYIDPASQTAAKCNFCAHRVETGLEPACVIVCPTQAIVTGDLDDPASHISGIVATEKVSVRKPQKGTDPKLFYVGIEGDLLEPTRLSREQGYLWADRQVGDGSLEKGAAGAAAAAPAFDPGVTREVYDVSHPAPWGWKIGTYLWSKSIAAGVVVVAAVLLGFGGVAASPLLYVIGPLIALGALLVTGALLVFDLKRPERFLYLLTKSNFRSWLVIGAWILIVYGALAVFWAVQGYWFEYLPPALVWTAGAFGIAAACYSAFLFAQAKGRDLWQSPVFFWHLLTHAFLAGSATLLIAAAIAGADPGTIHECLLTLLISVVVGLAMALAEIALPHVSADARLAAHALAAGRLWWRFWILSIGVGFVAPILLLTIGAYSSAPELTAVLAAVLALAGVWWFEDSWVRAGQSVPLS